jgi:hypothetical protein
MMHRICSVLVGQPERKRPNRAKEGDIKMDLEMREEAES